MAAIIINWTYAFADNTGFYLQRSSDSGEAWTQLPTTGLQYTYEDLDVIVGNTYWYQVAATNDFGTGSFSTIFSVYLSSPSVVTVYLTAGAKSDIKPFDGTTSSLQTPDVFPNIAYYGDTASFIQTFDDKFVGINKTITPSGGVIAPSGITYAITSNTNTGSITGPSTASIDTGSYIRIPPDTDLPYDEDSSVNVGQDMASGSLGFMTTVLLPTENIQLAMTSSDGKHWDVATTISADFQVFGQAWAYGNGRALTIGEIPPSYDTSDQRIQYTDDGGATWTTSSFSAVNAWIWDYTYDGAKYVGCCNGGTLVTSSNGIDWGTTTTGEADDLGRLLYNSGRYFAVGQPVRSVWGGTGKIYTSTDLETWQVVSSSVPTSNAYLDITYAPSLGMYLAVGEQGLIATSTDGVNWDDHSHPPPIFGNTLSSVAWNSVESFFAATDYYGYVYNSTDGINWTLNAINPNVQYQGSYYTYIVRLTYDASVNKFFLFGQAPPA